MTAPRNRLDGRAETVFRQLLDGNGDRLHPDDRQEAQQFWALLGQLERPDVDVNFARRDRRQRRWAVAAMVALCLMAGTAFWQWGPPGSRGMSGTFATGHGETSQIRLPDGSNVNLGAESRMAVEYSPGTRRIRLLAGEGYFDVARNPDRPFVVETPRGEVMALGTAFLIRVNAGDDQLTVVHGKVRVTARGQGEQAADVSRVAIAGQRMTYGIAVPGPSTSSGFVSRPVAVDGAAVAEWTKGTLVFQGDPLRDVIPIVNRYARRPIDVTGRTIPDVPVYAVVNIGDTDVIEEVLRETPPSSAKTR